MKLRLIKEDLEPITLEQISSFENKIGFKLPSEYKEFLIENNGAKCGDEVIKFKDFNKDYENGFLIRSVHVEDFNTIKKLMFHGIDIDENDTAKKYLKFANGWDGSSGMYLSLNPETYGYIYWADLTHEDEFIFVSKTFNEFLNSFEIDPELE